MDEYIVRADALEFVPINDDCMMAIVTRADGVLVTYELSMEEFRKLQRAIEREEKNGK